jgi:amino acid transporter
MTTPSAADYPTSTSPSSPAHPPTTAWTAERLNALGAVTDMATAAGLLGISRALAYQLAKDGQFPVPVIKVGRRYRVPITGLLTVLNLVTAEPPAPDLTRSGRHASITTTRSEAGPTSTPTSDDEGTP